MIVGAAICPPAPVLARELTGRDPVVPELREACAAVTGRLLRSRPDVIAVVGAADRTAAWPAEGRLSLAAFAPAVGTASGAAVGTASGAAAAAPEAAAARTAAGAASPALPLPVGLGARLLDEAGYRGPRVLRSVGDGATAAACLRLGASLGGLGDRTGLLVMADGSARRSLRAPGYLDPRAADFDAVLELALRGGDLEPLRTLDRVLARELLVSAAPAWQVLAGAMPGRAAAAEVRYADAPLGVFYLAGWLAGSGTDSVAT
jgi:hypothetical protein